MGWWSQDHGGAPGVQADGRLAACPASPNCVGSESVADGDTQHGIAPLPLAWDGTRLADAVSALGGEIVDRDDAYIHVTFTSRIFRFVDDLELRADGDRTQVRSASRVGHSDLEANRKRVELLRERLGAAAN